ncbi:uncharacterized protein LOC126880587 [Diabrotica virgifera virgifera]|uniref:Uncharacterized protein n=1 Tax=Diabrotica virgifera virgifera TaxID=50390 RepID=A0ABM5JRD4_DIAVI|nr:uncharacterized protein LOC126880587 [Diabrotica virgifera virgifera]
MILLSIFIFPVLSWIKQTARNTRSHKIKVDTQLHSTMRMIAGTIKSTPTQWLPVLSHIPPLHLRQVDALTRAYKKIMNNINLPIHQDTEDARNTHLRSRKPPIKTARMIHEEFNIKNAWSQEWNAWQNNMPCITHKPPGFDLSCKTLNRIRTRHGICAYMLHKWGKNPSPQCQTIDHIIEVSLKILQW